MIFYISDTHFGHGNIIKNCDQPFANVNEMNGTLINNWNNRVNNGDTYIIGDLMFRCGDPEEILKVLRGKKHLIIENHDKSWMNKVDTSKYFESVNNILIFNDWNCKRILEPDSIREPA